MPRLEMYDSEDPMYAGYEGSAFYHLDRSGNFPTIEFPSRESSRTVPVLGEVEMDTSLSLAHELGHHHSGLSKRYREGTVDFYSRKDRIKEELKAWEQVMRWKIPIGHWGPKERRQAAYYLATYYEGPFIGEEAAPYIEAMTALNRVEKKVRRKLRM